MKNNNNIEKNPDTLGFPFTLEIMNAVVFVICTITVIILRLCNVIELSWFWILSPVLATICIFILVSIVIIIIFMIKLVNDHEEIDFMFNDEDNKND